MECQRILSIEEFIELRNNLLHDLDLSMHLSNISASMGYPSYGPSAVVAIPSRENIIKMLCNRDFRRRVGASLTYYNWEMWPHLNDFRDDILIMEDEYPLDYTPEEVLGFSTFYDGFTKYFEGKERRENLKKDKISKRLIKAGDFFQIIDKEKGSFKVANPKKMELSLSRAWKPEMLPEDKKFDKERFYETDPKYLSKLRKELYDEICLIFDFVCHSSVYGSKEKGGFIADRNRIGVIQIIENRSLMFRLANSLPASVYEKYPKLWDRFEKLYVKKSLDKDFTEKEQKEITVFDNEMDGWRKPKHLEHKENLNVIKVYANYGRDKLLIPFYEEKK